jgi:hypothetical protein
MNNKLVVDVVGFLIQNGSDITKGIRNEVESIRADVNNRRTATRKKNEVVDRRPLQEKWSPLHLPPTRLTVPKRSERKPRVRPAARAKHSKIGAYDAEVRRRTELLASWVNKRRPSS